MGQPITVDDIAVPNRKYNPKQNAFLNALVGEARGDVAKAKKLAGYSDTTPLSQITQSLGDELATLARMTLASHAVKAAFKMVDLLDDPTKAGADNLIKVSNAILDRAGVTKPDPLAEVANAIRQSPVFILPPKTKVTINVEDSEEDGNLESVTTIDLEENEYTGD